MTGMQTVRHNAYHQDPYAQEFGINISAQLAQVEARVLPAPRVSSKQGGGLVLQVLDFVY
jgi:eukaryotic translation initiation factor 2C